MMHLAFRHDVGWDLRYLIARVTGAPVHVAILFGDECIEASFSGVRSIPTSARLARGRWTLVQVPVDPDGMRRAHRFATAQIGAKYDWLGVLWAWWFGRAAGSGVKSRWFCSELAAAVCVAGGINVHRQRMAYFTPRRLADIFASHPTTTVGR